jgi:adenosylcobinamide-phosphate synthase
VPDPGRRLDTLRAKPAAAAGVGMGRRAAGARRCLSSCPMTRIGGPASTRAPGAAGRMNGRRRPAGPGAPGRRWPLAGGIAAGVAADALLGDPRQGHPVAMFGRAAGAIEHRVYADSRMRGVVHAVASVTPVLGAAALADRLSRGRPWARLMLIAAATWAVTGAASLAAEAERIRAALAAGDLPAARAALPRLCGRDPDGLDPAELARAVIESVAENTSDAVVAPVLWGALAGPPGLAAYRAVNTLDSMVGYRSSRYARFGWASARLDDVANWGPARLTGLLAVACAPVADGSPAAAWRAFRGYGGRHPSPNAGRCEAAFAGALGIRLGGSNRYAGVTERRPWLGDGRAPGPADIGRAIRLSRAVTIAATGIAALTSMLTAGSRDLGTPDLPRPLPPAGCMRWPAPLRER